MQMEKINCALYFIVKIHFTVVDNTLQFLLK